MLNSLYFSLTFKVDEILQSLCYFQLKLVQSVIEGNMQDIKACLNQGADPNQLNEVCSVQQSQWPCGYPLGYF